jgi:hypothetical protein
LFQYVAGGKVTNVSEVMDSIRHSGDIPDWNFLSEILGQNALEILVASFNMGDISPRLVSIVNEVSDI